MTERGSSGALPRLGTAQLKPLTYVRPRSLQPSARTMTGRSTTFGLLVGPASGPIGTALWRPGAPRTARWSRNNSRNKLSATQGKWLTRNPHRYWGQPRAKPIHAGWGPGGRRFKSCLPDEGGKARFAGLFRWWSLVGRLRVRSNFGPNFPNGSPGTVSYSRSLAVSERVSRLPLDLSCLSELVVMNRSGE
jgi:hypothetical protein